MRFLILWLLLAISTAAATLRVATYNLEMYLDQPYQNTPAKSDLAKKYLRQAIKLVNADVLAVQEIGSTNALLELRDSLKKEGLEYRHYVHFDGRDQVINLAFLSKLPIKAARNNRNDNYLYQGRRHYVLRGFGEIDLSVGTETVTMITAHLKSQRVVAEGDQKAMREEEAIILREKIEGHFKRQPAAKLIVLGDLNDGIDSKTLKTVIGRGKNALQDLRPAERNGDSLPHPNPKYEPRNIVWTHYYGKEESYSRLDYILTSQSLRKTVVPDQTYVLAMPNWGAGSDHRPVTATFSW